MLQHETKMVPKIRPKLFCNKFLFIPVKSYIRLTVFMPSVIVCICAQALFFRNLITAVLDGSKLNTEFWHVSCTAHGLALF